MRGIYVKLFGGPLNTDGNLCYIFEEKNHFCITVTGTSQLEEMCYL